VQRGNAQLELAFAVCYGAVLLGDMMIFLVGYRLGPSLFKTSLLSARFTPEFVQRISVSMERHALVMIFLARHLFYLRTATFLTCGAFRMGFLRFMAADALAALISAPLMMGVGYLAAEHLPYAFEMMKKAKTVSIILGLGAVGFVIVMVLRYEKKTT
jgi:membrane protein DedA with SNARE-associated domain